MSTTTKARSFLKLNASFSVLTGLALLFFPHALTELIWLGSTTWKVNFARALGFGLLIFAIGLLLMSSNRYVSKAEVMFIVWADIGWIAASVAMLIFGGHLLTNTGKLVIDVVALCVGIFAAGQYFGAKNIRKPESRVSFSNVDNTLTAIVERQVNAPPNIVWRIMIDHPSYADVASNISKVTVISGNGIGMQRRCYGPKGENWNETCVTFNEGESFGFKVHTDAADYPYPFESVSGVWSVSASGSGSEIKIDIKVDPKGNLLTRKLFPTIAKSQFTPILIELADAWALRMEREANELINSTRGNSSSNCYPNSE